MQWRCSKNSRKNRNAVFFAHSERWGKSAGSLLLQICDRATNTLRRFNWQESHFNATCKLQAVGRQSAYLHFASKFSTFFGMKAKMPKSHCPINFALELFGDKWTLLIIRDLLFSGKKYYGDFLNSEEKISTNILADRLNMLEREGFVSKINDEHHGSKYVYAATQKAEDL